MKYLPKLNLRDFLWLIVVVALFVMWWTDHRELTAFRKQQAAADRVHAEAQALADEQYRLAKQKMDEMMKSRTPQVIAEEQRRVAELIEQSKSIVTPPPTQ